MANKTRPNNHGASEVKRQRQQEILRKRASLEEAGQTMGGGASFRRPKKKDAAPERGRRGYKQGGK